MSERRRTVPFDPEYFARRAATGEVLDMEAAFRYAYASKLWHGSESRSGSGSSLDQTAVLRGRLPTICAELGVQSLLDLPCGDWHWMAHTKLPGVDYIGADLLPELIAAHQDRYSGCGREFRVLDLLRSPLPTVDLVLCRDCLVHLCFADIRRAVANLRDSGSRYLLATTFPDECVNEEIRTGDWRPLNLEESPLNWPRPSRLFVEGCTECDGRFADKSLGLWSIASLPDD